MVVEPCRSCSLPVIGARVAGDRDKRHVDPSTLVPRRWDECPLVEKVRELETGTHHVKEALGSKKVLRGTPP